MTLPRIPTEWRQALAEANASPQAKALGKFLQEREQAGASIYPPMPLVFAALQAVAPADVRVVILAQDPYYRVGQAMGLALSVPRGVPTPPSLLNMQKELVDDLGVHNTHGDLTRWAREGILLLNTLLTVEEGTPFAHKGKGWETITDAIIKTVSDQPLPTVFLLMGAPAQKKARLIDETHNFIIRTPHPSPLSAHRGFFGSKPYSQINAILEKNGLGTIDWSTGK